MGGFVLYLIRFAFKLLPFYFLLLSSFFTITLYTKYYQPTTKLDMYYTKLFPQSQANSIFWEDFSKINAECYKTYESREIIPNSRCDPVSFPERSVAESKHLVSNGRYLSSAASAKCLDTRFWILVVIVRPVKQAVAISNSPIH